MMALSEDWLQDVIQYKVTLEAPENNDRCISRAIVDGVLVVYDLEDPPAWLEVVLDDRDEDGNTSSKFTLTEVLDGVLNERS